MEKHKAETLVRTGPGTSTGNLLRRYWVPVLLSREIAEPDGPQVRVQILGEKLLAFRDSQGRRRPDQRVLLASGCIALLRPQRGERYPLCLPRVEVRHPRKMRRRAAGSPGMRAHGRSAAYPCLERAGVVWAYMGPPDKQPEGPGVEWANLPDSHVFVSSGCRSATTCRPWKVASTPAMCPSCTSSRWTTILSTREPRPTNTSRRTATSPSKSTVMTGD